MFKALKNTSVSFKDSLLILPVVSLANLPQLAADLLIHSLNFRLVGTLSARDHIPLTGSKDGPQPQQQGILSPVESKFRLLVFWFMKAEHPA